MQLAPLNTTDATCRSELMSRDVPVVVVIRSEYIWCPMMYHSECSGEGEVSFCHFLRELLSPKIDAEKLKRRRKCHLGHSLAKHPVILPEHLRWLICGFDTHSCWATTPVYLFTFWSLHLRWLMGVQLNDQNFVGQKVSKISRKYLWFLLGLLQKIDVSKL